MLGAGRLAAIASWALASLAAVSLATGVLLAYADRTVFAADGFADRAAASLQAAPARAAAARRVTDAAIRARPELVAVRPILEGVADGLMRTEAFRSLVRGAARDVHRSAFERHSNTVTLRVADVGILLGQAVRQLRPDVARRIPAGLETRLAAVTGGAGAVVVRAAERGEQVRHAALIAFAAALLLGLAAFAVVSRRRDAAFRLGVTVAGAAVLLALTAGVGPRLAATHAPPADRAAVRAVLGTWLDPLLDWSLALAAGGLVVAMAAASVVRPIAVVPLLRRAGTALAATPRDPRWRAVRALAAIAVGGVVIVERHTALEIAAAVAGALLLLCGIAELLRLTAEPTALPRAQRRRSVPRSIRIAAVAALLLVALAGVGALAAGDAPEAPRTGRCNGFAALCARRVNQVAFAGTHNSMAADREPGWLFVAQDAGIPSQLDFGIRALLVDTHYGFSTPRGVATQLGAGSKSRGKLDDELGEAFVRTAERLRTRIGYHGGGTREVFLCHAFCEVGATKAVDAFAGIHRFLVTHPEEVVLLSIEDDTDARDTADVIRRSGLGQEVYRGAAKPPWPTLRQLIDRDERLIVLVENHSGGVSWLHHQPAVAQETPYAFPTVDALAARSTCRPNRGGTAGSLFLVNHWVDTTPAPRPANARRVNARDFLRRRLSRCRKTRGMLPNIVAVDFFRQGDVLGDVNSLNRVR